MIAQSDLIGHWLLTGGEPCGASVKCLQLAASLESVSDPGRSCASDRHTPTNPSSSTDRPPPPLPSQSWLHRMLLLPEILRTVLQILQVPLPFAPPPTAAPASPASSRFHLQRHFTHHPTDDQALLFSNEADSTALGELHRLELRTRPVGVQRPRSRHAFEAARVAGRMSTLGFTPSIEWEDDTVQGPGELARLPLACLHHLGLTSAPVTDVEHRETLLSLAKMTSDACVPPSPPPPVPVAST
jgi:hypothetical protein